MDDDNNDPGVEISIPVDEVPAEEPNPVTDQSIADTAGDAADSAAQNATDTLDKHGAAVAKATAVTDIASRIETGTIDPNEKPKETGEASGKATEAVNEATTCGGNGDGDSCKTQMRGVLEIFGTIMESVVAPVAGPCQFWVLHKALVAFAVIFFFVNLGGVLDTMANSTVTDIALKHEAKIVYPDIYICSPADAWFYAFKCCGDTCGATTVDDSHQCSNAGMFSLALEGSIDGCEMGLFPNYDLGRSAASSCPYKGYRGQGPLTDDEWAAYVHTYKMEYAGSWSTPLKDITWVRDDFAVGLENRMPTFTPSKSVSLVVTIISTVPFAKGDVITGGLSKVTATVTGVKPPSILILSDVSCPVTIAKPKGDCTKYFTDHETLTATGSGATGTFAKDDQELLNGYWQPRGYRYRNTVFKPICFYFKNAENAEASYDTADTYITTAFGAVMTQNMLTFPPSSVAYLMDNGKVPYEGTAAATTGGILATKVVFPGYGNVGLGQISIDKIKDTSKGETAWTTLYDVDTTSFPLRAQNVIGASNYKAAKCSDATKTTQAECESPATWDVATGESRGFTITNHMDQLTTDYGKCSDPNKTTKSTCEIPDTWTKIPGAGKCSDPDKTTRSTCEIADTWTAPIRDEFYTAIDGKLWCVVSFTISNFVVREITIRNHTLAEVWAAVGGLWSGSLLILMFFFSTSDVSNAKHRFYRTFNFCCPGTRDEWLEEAGKEVANAEEEEENDNFREMYLAMKVEFREMYLAMKAAETDQTEAMKVMEAKKDE